MAAQSLRDFDARNRGQLFSNALRLSLNTFGNVSENRCNQCSTGSQVVELSPPQLFPCPLGHCPFSAGGSGGAPVHGPERPPGEKRHRAGSFQDLQFKHSKQASGSTHESSVKLPGSLSCSESRFHRSPWFILV